MNVLICGGSGFLGQNLARFFTEKGDRVVIVSRTSSTLPVKQVTWKQETEILDELNTADVLINLAGKSVNCRYTKKNKTEILNSRIATTKLLANWLQQVSNPPKIWLNASTATIYRHALDRPMTEYNGEVGNDFSMNVAKQWEEAFFKAKHETIRKVAMRTSIVLGKDGGALIPLQQLTKMGLGGKMGSGKQMVSWIHITDFCRAVSWIINHIELDGPVNITAPYPATNEEQMMLLRKSLKKKTGIPASSLMLKIGAWLIGTETELILKSRWVLPERLTESGFRFNYPKMEMALTDLVS